MEIAADWNTITGGIRTATATGIGTGMTVVRKHGSRV
jgi:hypothetical protein